MTIHVWSIEPNGVENKTKQKQTNKHTHTHTNAHTLLVSKICKTIIIDIRMVLKRKQGQSNIGVNP